jgi:hypothetical protein
MDAQFRRIDSILGESAGQSFEDGVAVFYEHLCRTLELPCEVTGTEDFRWEEPFVVGGWDRKEYERLKKDRPSYRDRYDLLRIESGPVSEWMLFGPEDIAAFVRRKSDGKEFCLGLAELKAVNRKSPNAQLLHDFAVFFVNNR